MVAAVPVAAAVPPAVRALRQELALLRRLVHRNSNQHGHTRAFLALRRLVRAAGVFEKQQGPGKSAGFLQRRARVSAKEMASVTLRGRIETVARASTCLEETQRSVGQGALVVRVAQQLAAELLQYMRKQYFVALFSVWLAAAARICITTADITKVLCEAHITLRNHVSAAAAATTASPASSASSASSAASPSPSSAVEERMARALAHTERPGVPNVEHILNELHSAAGRPMDEKEQDSTSGPSSNALSASSVVAATVSTASVTTSLALAAAPTTAAAVGGRKRSRATAFTDDLGEAVVVESGATAPGGDATATAALFAATSSRVGHRGDAHSQTPPRQPQPQPLQQPQKKHKQKQSQICTGKDGTEKLQQQKKKQQKQKKPKKPKKNKRRDHGTMGDAGEGAAAAEIDELFASLG